MPPQRINSRPIFSKGFIAPISVTRSVNEQTLTEELNIKAQQIRLDLAAGNITDKQAAILYLELADIAAASGAEYKALGYQIQSQNLVNKVEKAGISAGKKAAEEAEREKEAVVSKKINEVEEQIKEEFDKVNAGADPVDIYNAVAILIIAQRQLILESDIDEDLQNDLLDYFDGTKEWEGIGSRGGINASDLGLGLKGFKGTSGQNIYGEFWDTMDDIRRNPDVEWVWAQVVDGGSAEKLGNSHHWEIANPERLLDYYALPRFDEEGNDWSGTYFFSPQSAGEDREGNKLFAFLDFGVNEDIKLISEENLASVQFEQILITEFITPFGEPKPISPAEAEQQKLINEINSRPKERGGLVPGTIKAAGAGVEAGAGLISEAIPAAVRAIPGAPGAFGDFISGTNRAIGQGFSSLLPFIGAGASQVKTALFGGTPTTVEQARQNNPLGIAGQFANQGFQAFKAKFFPR